MVLVPMTVVETPAFLREAATALTEEERTELVSYLAANPEAGDVMPETGGARKLRWKAQERGKSWAPGRSTTITMNRSKAEPNEMRKLLPRLIAGYRKRMAK